MVNEQTHGAPTPDDGKKGESWEERWEHHKEDLWGLAIMGHTMTVSERADVIASIKAFIRSVATKAERRGIERALENRSDCRELYETGHYCDCCERLSALIPTDPAV